MGMSRCYSLMKCLLILFNIIFLVVGVGACGLSGWALWDGRAGETPQGRAALCALVAWSAALAVGAAAALAGAAKHSASLLAAAFALLALTAVAEAAAAWWGATHLPQLRRAFRDRLDLVLRHDYGVLPARTQMLDAIQQGLECCGVDGARDWQGSAWAMALRQSEGDDDGAGGTAPLDLSVSAPTAHYWVPESCCISRDHTECTIARRVPAASGGGEGVHSAGCGGRVLSALAAGARLPAGVGAALLAAHALTLLLALALCLRAHPHHEYKA